MNQYLCVPILGILVCLISGKSIAQQPDLVDKMVRYYNGENYDSLYLLLEGDFRKQFPRDAHDTFYKASVRTQFGRIERITFVSRNGPFTNYLVDFERGKLTLLLSISDVELIESLQWQPYEAIVTEKKPRTAIQTNNPRRTNIELRIDSLALGFLESPFNCGLSIGIVRNGKVSTYFYGETRKGNGTLPNGDTVYEIGSITKTFTGLILAEAVHSGMISLDEDIRKYLPGDYPNLEFDGHPILVKHLSNHTSHLPANPSNLMEQKGFNLQDPFAAYDTELLFHFLKEVKLDAQPGSRFEYSNTGVGLLGVILSRIYDKPLAILYEEQITKPLKLGSTGLSVMKNVERLATPYSGLNGEETSYWHWSDMSAAGGLKSTLHDLINYIQFQMKDNESIALSHQATFTDAQQSIGLTWMLFPYKNMKFIYHDGRTSGFSSVCGFIKEKQTGIVVLSNSGIDCNEVGFGIMRELLKQP